MLCNPIYSKYYFIIWHWPLFKGSEDTRDCQLLRRTAQGDERMQACVGEGVSFRQRNQETSSGRRYWLWISKGELDLHMWEWERSHKVMSFLFYRGKH